MNLDPTSVIFLGILIAFWVALLVPQRLQAKKRKRALEGLAVGDDIVTTGGLIGKIRRLDDDEIVLDVGNRVEVRVVRSAYSHHRAEKRERKKK